MTAPTVPEMKDGLLPCPFCGVEAAVGETRTGGFLVGCTGMHGVMMRGYKTGAAARAAWNARVVPAPTEKGDGWPAITDAWADTYCELTGRDPGGQQVTFVDGGVVTTFREVAKREIDAMLCAASKPTIRAMIAATQQATGEGGAVAWRRRRDEKQRWTLMDDPENAEQYRQLGYEVRPLFDRQQAVSPPEGVGWRPIETAPKDGTEVILATVIDTLSYEEPATGRWTGRAWEPSWQGFSVIEYQGDFGTDYRSFGPQPTHWMPLPPAPDASQGEK